MHIGYIPTGRVLGRSKLARIADMYARRLQVQERLTGEVAAAVQRVLSPDGIAVVAECTHMAMVRRGGRKAGATTLTQSMGAGMQDDPVLRDKCWALLGAGGSRT